MSETPGKPDDRELEEFLAGNGATSRGWRAAAGSESAPPELDRAVLDFAQAELVAAQRRRPRWQRPLAIAASLVLASGILLALMRDPQGWQQLAMQRQDAPVVAEPAASAAEESEALAPQPAPAQEPEPQAQPEQAQAESKSVEQERQKMRAEAAAEVMAQREQAAAKQESTPPPPPPMGAVQAPAPMAGTAPRARSFAAPAAPPAAAADAMQDSVLAKAQAPWQAPVFDGLKLGEATREQVRARLGEPTAQGVSYPDGSSRGEEDLPFERYERIPGRSGVHEFYYQRVSGVLLAVRVSLPQATSQDAWLAQQGWKEAPRIERWSQGACREDDPAGEDVGYPRYLVYPQRGAYAYAPEAGVISDVVFEYACP